MSLNTPGVLKLVWEKVDGRPKWLVVRLLYEHGAITPTGLRSTHLDPVQDWCVANKCGTRISFDMFKFQNDKEMALFLLRWDRWQVS